MGNELRRKYGDGVVVEVVDIENYKAETRLPKEKLVLYLMATYGECARQAAGVESEQQAGDEESSRLGAGPCSGSWCRLTTAPPAAVVPDGVHAR